MLDEPRYEKTLKFHPQLQCEVPGRSDIAGTADIFLVEEISGNQVDPDEFGDIQGKSQIHDQKCRIIVFPVIRVSGKKQISGK